MMSYCFQVFVSRVYPIPQVNFEEEGDELVAHIFDWGNAIDDEEATVRTSQRLIGYGY